MTVLTSCDSSSSSSSSYSPSSPALQVLEYFSGEEVARLLPGEVDTRAFTFTIPLTKVLPSDGTKKAA